MEPETYLTLMWSFYLGTGMSESLTAKLCGMANDYIQTHGTEEFSREYRGWAGFLDFTGEAIESLWNYSRASRALVMGDPVWRDWGRGRDERPTHGGPGVGPAPQPTPEPPRTPAPVPTAPPAPKPKPAPKPRKVKGKSELEEFSSELEEALKSVPTGEPAPEPEPKPPAPGEKERQEGLTALREMMRRALRGDKEAQSYLNQHVPGWRKR